MPVNNEKLSSSLVTHKERLKKTKILHGLEELRACCIVKGRVRDMAHVKGQF